MTFFRQRVIALLCHVVWFWQGYDLMGVLSASHPALTEEIVLPSFSGWVSYLAPWHWQGMHIAHTNALPLAEHILAHSSALW